MRPLALLLLVACGGPVPGADGGSEQKDSGVAQCVPSCISLECGTTDGCGNVCPSGSRCTYTACRKYPCGCAAGDQWCLSTCQLDEGTCCDAYAARYPADRCARGQ